MSSARFTFYNVAGAIIWVGGLILGSYLLGSRFPNLDKIILPMLMLAIVLTMGSTLYKFGSTAKKRRQLKQAISEEFSYIFNRKA